VLYTALDSTAKSALWVLPLEGDTKPFPFLRTEYNNYGGQFSPDARWVAYTSDESGRSEIYVRSFSAESVESGSHAGGKWLISNDGGSDARRRGDGRELYYRARDGNIMVVDVSTDPVFKAGVPKMLFQAPPTTSTVVASYTQWDVTADGNVFRCPQGQTLRYRGMDHQAQGHFYQTTASQCRGCPVKKRCTGGATRRLFVHWHEAARQTARELAQTPAYACSKRERNKIEALFSELKLRMGLRRVRLRRLWNVSEQFYLAATAQNLKRLVRFLAQRESAPVPCSA